MRLKPPNQIPGIHEPSTAGAGPVNPELYARVNFTYNTVSPLTIINLLAGDEIDTVKLVITTAFDDASATLSVGTVASPTLIFNAVKANKAQQYSSFEHHTIGLAEILRLTINSGTSTQGAGYIIYRVRRP